MDNYHEDQLEELQDILAHLCKVGRWKPALKLEVDGEDLIISADGVTVRSLASDWRKPRNRAATVKWIFELVQDWREARRRAGGQ